MGAARFVPRKSAKRLCLVDKLMLAVVAHAADLCMTTDGVEGLFRQPSTIPELLNVCRQVWFGRISGSLTPSSRNQAANRSRALMARGRFGLVTSRAAVSTVATLQWSLAGRFHELNEPVRLDAHAGELCAAGILHGCPASGGILSRATLRAALARRSDHLNVRFAIRENPNYNTYQRDYPRENDSTDMRTQARPTSIR